MPDQKITDLVDGDPLQPTDEFVVARGGDNFKIDGAAVVDAATAAVTKHDVTLAGNTAGVLALVSSGTLSLAGGNNITLSQAGNAVTISGAAGGTETQTAISGISASDTLYTSGTVRITGSQGATVRSGTGQLVVIDVPATSSLSATGAVSISTNGSTISIGAPTQTVQTQNLIAATLDGNTAGALALMSSGTVTLAGGNNITLSQAGNAITISGAAAGGAQTAISGIANSETTYTSGTVSLSELGAVTIRSTTGNQFQISVNSQSVQPETQTFIAGISASDTLYTSGNVRITGVGGGVTVSSNTGQRVDISVAAPVAQTAQTGISGIANSQTTYTSGTVSLSELGAITIRSTTGNQFQLSVNAQTTQTQGVLSVGVSTGGNTVGNTQVSTGSRFVLVASGNATASQATAAGASTVTISVGAQSVQTQGILNVALSNVGNTAGDTGINSGTRLVLSGGANVTLSQVTAANATTLGIVAAGGGAGQFSGGVSTGGNTAGATGITGSQNVFVGVSPMSLSQTTGANGGTISILAPATSSLSATGAIEISTNGSTISIGAPNVKELDDMQNFPMGLATLMTHAASISKTPFYFPMSVGGRLTANSYVIRLSAVTTATLQSFSVHAGFYTLVNSTSMALLGSWSESYVQSTASSASWSGVRNYVMTGIGTHTALSVLTGGDYVVGMMFSAGAAGSMAQSIFGAGTAAGPLGRVVPGVNQNSTGTSQGAMPLNGRGSTTVNALPANVVASELINQGSGASMQLHPWVYIRS